MTSYSSSNKQLFLADCQHPSDELCECRKATLAEILAYWNALEAAVPVIASLAEPPRRERVELTGRELPKPYQRPSPEPNLAEEDLAYLRPRVDFDLGALGAWCCLGLAVSLILLLVIRQIWLFLT
ncbi:MAG: hypothetical protein ACRDSH_19770 [Pseudonocardiaceae bacterium]